MNFLPKGYEAPKTISDFMKLQDGKNKLRILSKSPVLGWMWWTDETEGKRKPHRVKTKQEVPAYVKESKHFWAMVVYNYDDKLVQMLEIPQKSIQDGMRSLFEDDDWGDPHNYDISVKKEGELLNTEYNVVASGANKPLSLTVDEQHKAKVANLEALFDNKDPFAEVAPTTQADGSPLK